MGEKTTFFTVDRKLLNDELWLAEPFTKGQAWLDLIGRASYKDTDELRRGEILTSERELAARWKWAPSKVHRFLKQLENAQMIKRSREWSSERSREWSRLSLEKYGFYQDARSREWSSERSSKRNNTYLYKQDINNINNISLYMPDGMEDRLRQIFGDKTEQLVEDVRRYYEAHPDKEFPGWESAVAQFNANQARWERSGRRGRDPLQNAINAFLREDD